MLSLISDQCWLVVVDVFFINIILIRLMLILKLLIMSKHLMPGPDVPLAMCQLCTAGNFSTYRKPRQLHTILLGMPLSKDKFRRFSTLTNPPPLIKDLVLKKHFCPFLNEIVVKLILLFQKWIKFMQHNNILSDHVHNEISPQARDQTRDPP